ncbi:CBS domain protein [Streptomyces sp. 846.5]|nr:CBS domain-containing protein [Streptomyces sp. 846.5]TDT97377.1 CBS domain protein [Streptomyces sp. 846.5]
MRHRTVQDVMTHQVVTAHRDTPFKAVAALLARNDVSAVPVVDPRQHPIGIVSEGDLLRKESALPDPRGHAASVWMRPRDRKRAEAETAETLMTSTVFAARPEWSLVEAARMMDRHHVKRLPVIDEAGVLVGIVSRSDLIRVFLRPDGAIRQEIVHDVLNQTLLIPLTDVQVEVRDGVVTLRGTVERQTLVPVVVRLCRSVDGVVAVHDQLRYTFDDRRVDLGPDQVHGVIRTPHH